MMGFSECLHVISHDMIVTLEAYVGKITCIVSPYILR